MSNNNSFPVVGYGGFFIVYLNPKDQAFCGDCAREQFNDPDYWDKKNNYYVGYAHESYSKDQVIHCDACEREL